MTEDIFKPNGLCFSPDYKKLYVADTGASHYAEAKKEIKVWDVVNGVSLQNGKTFTSMDLEMEKWTRTARDKVTKAGMADGIRCDEDGNIWSSAGWVGDGYDGVHVFEPKDGKRIGQILLPKSAATSASAAPNATASS